MYINGEWVHSKATTTYSTLVPYHRESWAVIPSATDDDVHDAIDATDFAFTKVWKNTVRNMVKKLFTHSLRFTIQNIPADCIQSSGIFNLHYLTKLVIIFASFSGSPYFSFPSAMLFIRNDMFFASMRIV